MDLLRFAHRFFHFECAAWERATKGSAPTWEFVRQLFSAPILPRRENKGEAIFGFEAALRVHELRLAEEDSLGIRAISEAMPAYPAAIKAHIRPEHRPALLYLRGNDPPEESKTLAIVGTRKPSEAGQEAADSFATYLGSLGFHLASGLALGIDSIVHERSLQSGTVAVLGSGLGEIYPWQNQGLAEKILEAGGTLLSPFPIGQVPLPQNFPARNELISALSAGVIVIEGSEKSGASITGKQALAMGKTVVALTQDFRSEFGRGAIRLQQEGATLVAREEEAVEAIFSRFGGYPGTLPAFPYRSRRIFTFADFRAATKLDVPAALALLEEGILHGTIERAGQGYRRRKN